MKPSWVRESEGAGALALAFRGQSLKGAQWRGIYDNETGHVHNLRVESIHSHGESESGRALSRLMKTQMRAYDVYLCNFVYSAAFVYSPSPFPMSLRIY